jgi:hypothetical protein
MLADFINSLPAHLFTVAGYGTTVALQMKS